MHNTLMVILTKVFSNLLSLCVKVSKLSESQLTVIAYAIHGLEHTHSTTAFDSSSTPVVPFEVCHEISEPPSAACS
jgi:hypothetical protein